ncbi:metal-dependent hydrolase [Paenibacillus sp. UMB4589-SE434]|uniref:metal-dependent hydrolase n=1 Tax=Paenibacillus sp. UMB4589-SE434 TaxID=3046314 RepID=UPI00254BDE5E|nr:metal-dependent hydrolase [Paenibacillus sp. UMB4589-SE434]MDK8179432.1 metal-dependent hydrolase [Paenibacillus sp. UMB4589-SE434]
MRCTFHGHACLEIQSDKHRLIIDPFLTSNPSATVQAVDIKVDTILLTHGHGDHIEDAAAIANHNEATVVAIVELADFMSKQGVHSTIGMNLGGGAELSFGHIKWVPALHSSSYSVDGQNVYMGNPAGIVLQIDGMTIYHAGDTALFSDMKLIGERYKPDIAFLPIGSFFTMDPIDALQAAKWVQAKHVVPVHYNTFPPIQQDGRAFVEQLAHSCIQGHYMAPGQTLNTADWSVE